MNGYYGGYAVYPLAMNNLLGVSPQPLPPNIIAMATPLPVPPSAPLIMLAVSGPSLAMGTPLPDPPAIHFLSPQPEPPGIAFKRYGDYLMALKKQTAKSQISDGDTTLGIMLAVPNPSFAMGTPMPIPPSTMTFLSPQPEPPGKALVRYKKYLADLTEWVKLYEKSVTEALSIVDEIDQELQRF